MAEATMAEVDTTREQFLARKRGDEARAPSYLLSCVLDDMSRIVQRPAARLGDAYVLFLDRR